MELQLPTEDKLIKLTGSLYAEVIIYVTMKDLDFLLIQQKAICFI